jgi:hypothetical protein
MRTAIQRAHRKNPEKYKKISIQNLSKNRSDSLSGENNPNWKSGITPASTQWRNKHSQELKRWRKEVIERDDRKCRSCGSKIPSDLQAHHIVPLAESHPTALMTMNGVTLCKACHYKTDSYGGHPKVSDFAGIGKTLAVVQTIPHEFQEYPTVGNYQSANDGTRLIFVSDMKNPSYELAVAIHELVEQHLTALDGISVKDIDRFDKLFDEEYASGLHTDLEEPGDDTRSPYFWHHQFAGIIERLFIQGCGIRWKDYEDTVTRIWRSGDNEAGLKEKTLHD